VFMVAAGKGLEGTGGEGQQGLSQQFALFSHFWGDGGMG